MRPSVARAGKSREFPRSLAHQLLLERPSMACRAGLPTDGAAVVAWLDPLAVYGRRLAAAVETARGNDLVMQRARAR